MRHYYFDDSGSRKNNDPEAPYFVLAGFGIDTNDIQELNTRVKHTSSLYGMELEYPRELKFKHVGTMKDDGKKAQWMIRAGLSAPHERRALVQSTLRILPSIPSVSVIGVAVNTHELFSHLNPVEEAVKLLLERVNLESRKFDTISSVFMDEERVADKDIRGVLRAGSNYIKNYERIVDTISFMPSDESPCIQLADLVAGGLARFQNRQDPGYLRAFEKSCAKHDSGSISGYGVKVYPKGFYVSPSDRNTSGWSDFDKKIHDFEFSKVMNKSVQWNEDGRPDQVWTLDSDTRTKETGV